MNSKDWVISQPNEPKSLEKLQNEHRNVMEWERKILQRTIDRLTAELNEKKETIAHLEECIKGEDCMITILKRVINEEKARHVIDKTRAILNRKEEYSSSNEE